MVIRKEEERDFESITAVHHAAFEKEHEAEIVLKSRQLGELAVSLVAEVDGQIVGHALYSTVRLVRENGEETAVALGPIGVLPEFQKQGIGAHLITKGNTFCFEAGHNLIFVLGHASYYPKFGFAPTAPYGITCEYDVPPEAFMVVARTPDGLDGHCGTVYYGNAFR